MEKLWYFILGMVAYIAAIPILEALVTLVATALEIPKGKLSLKIAQLNEKLSQVGEEPKKTYAIGFQAPEIYDEEEEDE